MPKKKKKKKVIKNKFDIHKILQERGLSPTIEELADRLETQRKLDEPIDPFGD